jgi:YHS domain-containing protein
MTAQRQQQHRIGARPLFCRGIAAVLLLVAVTAPVVAVRAATTQRIVVDRFSGLAIWGYDPVAYFVKGQPVQGLETFEAWQGGVVWRFHNEGNRASFLEHPDIYGPQFGGYDPVDVARGVTVAGSPQYWIVANERLYLFSREETRRAFAAHPARYMKTATARWSALEQELAQ